MIAQAVRRLYAPEFMLKPTQRLGDIPDTKKAYSVAFSIAWASIAETVLIALISMADTLMVSSVGEAAIAAVGLATQPRFIMQTLAMSLNVAVASITARRRGENDMQGATDCLKQGMLLCIASSLLLAFLVRPFTRELLLFAGAQTDTIELVKTYFDILLIGIPISNLSLTISAAQRGTGQTRVSMQINMTANIVNLVLNYLLIGGKFGFPALGVKGAAIATVIGWICGLVLAIASVCSPNRFLFILSRKGWRIDRKLFSSMMKVSSGSFLEQICMRVGFLSYSKLVAGLGTILFAAHQILVNLMSLSFSFGEGFGIAASSLVGQNLGAKRPDLSIVYGKVCQRMSIVTSFLIFVVLALFGRDMIALFSQDAQILEVGEKILYIIGIVIVGQASQMVFMGSLRGAGDTKYTAVVSMISIMILRPIIAGFLTYSIGLSLVGAWLAMLFDQYLRLYLCARRFSSGKWTTIKL